MSECSHERENRGQIRRRVVACLVFVGCRKEAGGVEQPKPAAKAGTGFFFAVYGDSRSMMYLPYRADQETEARDLMVDLFSLVLPEKVSEAMVRTHVKLTYDPDTKELVQIVMPFETKSEVTTLTVDRGWVTEASVEDVKLLPGVRRTMFRLEGGDWVAREVVKDVQRGRAKFVLRVGVAVRDCGVVRQREVTLARSS